MYVHRELKNQKANPMRKFRKKKSSGSPFNIWIAMAAYTASQSDLSELIYTYRVQFSTACQILRYDTDQCEFNICKQSKTFQQLDNILTRQLPMGAGHCQWGGLTGRNVCNIHGDAHLAPSAIGCSRRACDTQMEGKLGNI